MTLVKPPRAGRSETVALRGPAQDYRPTFPIVEAKLNAPPERRGTVERARLLTMLEERSDARIVSLIAPPGYGKTTLLAGWAARSRRPVAWLTLDKFDNDPAVLMTYLAAAADRIRPVDSLVGRSMTGPTRRVVASGVPRLLAELSRWPKPGLIILDDVHRLVDVTCLDALTALIDHLPAGFRIALAARSEPGIPLARMRAQREVLDIGPEVLALDPDETASVVSAAGCELKPTEVEVLRVRTEGWPAAIYLFALAISRGRAMEHLDGIADGDYLIAEYIRSEFLEGLSDDDVTFLTRSIVLERISPRVAEAVTGLSGASDRLRRLSQSSRFINRVPADEPSYRYHNLLRDFLTSELERREPESAPALHRRAAAWYEQAERHDLAIEHAIAAGDLDTAAGYVTAAALRTHYLGHTSTLERWLDAFTDETYESHPPLAVISAWVNLLIGRPERADWLADIAERATHHGRPGDGSASFASQRAMLQSVMARSGPQDVLAAARLAVSLERPGSPWRSIALLSLGSARELLGQLDSADAAYAEAVSAGLPNAPTTVMIALSKRASLSMAAGDWQAAEDFVAQADEIRTARDYDGFVTLLLVHAISARVAIQRGDLEAGRESLVRTQLLRPLASHAMPWVSVDALLHLSRAYLAISDPAGAQLTLREAEQIVRRRPALGTLIEQLVETRKTLADASATLVGSSSLTAAELRVLPLLPTYLSFEDIATRLMISRNTVKTHAMSIYGKLWASSRGEAVERAVEIGLLEPYPALVQSDAARVRSNGASRHP